MMDKYKKRLMIGVAVVLLSGCHGGGKPASASTSNGDTDIVFTGTAIRGHNRSTIKIREFTPSQAPSYLCIAITGMDADVALQCFPKSKGSEEAQ